MNSMLNAGKIFNQGNKKLQILVGTGMYQNRFLKWIKTVNQKKNQIKNVILHLLYITYLYEIIPIMVFIAFDESTKCVFCVYSAKENINIKVP